MCRRIPLFQVRFCFLLHRSLLIRRLFCLGIEYTEIPGESVNIHVRSIQIFCLITQSQPLWILSVKVLFSFTIVHCFTVNSVHCTVFDQVFFNLLLSASPLSTQGGILRFLFTIFLEISFASLLNLYFLCLSHVLSWLSLVNHILQWLPEEVSFLGLVYLKISLAYFPT